MLYGLYKRRRGLGAHTPAYRAGAKPVAGSLILATLLLVSCGIDTIVYLSLKARVTSSLDASFVFSGPQVIDGNDSNYYLGLNVYYRIYASESDAASDLSSLTSKQSATNAVPGAYVAAYLASASGLGYQRIVLIDPANGGASEPFPTFAKNVLPPDGYIAVSFPPSGEPILEINLGAASTGTTRYWLRRAVTNASGNLQFLTAPVAGAADYRSGTVSADTYYVQFFAAGYGMNDTLDEIYGDAVYLGRITLNLNL